MSICDPVTATRISVGIKKYFMGAFNPATSGSSPVHIIYTLIIYSQIGEIFVFVLWK